MIVDPEKYGMSTDAKFVILLANQPLIHAAYENHHTREIASDDKPADSLPPIQRQRLGERLKWRLGQRLLGLNDQQLTQTLQAFGKENIA
jgi:hypothetical protein